MDAVPTVEATHRVVLSVVVLVAVAFIFQGVAESSPTAHSLILALLVGVLIMLAMNEMGWVKGLAAYPWALPAVPKNPTGGH